MPITKIHAIRKTLDKSIDYITNPDKTEASKVDNYYEDALNYISNPEKTNNKIFVTGINCNPQTAYQEMRIEQLHWEAIRGVKSNNVAYHIIQSFDPKDEKVDYNTAHKIGIELAKSICGNRKAVVSTHIDKDHIHNHIIFSAWDMENGCKYRDNKTSYQHIRDVSDQLAVKYGLKIIEDPDKGKSHSYKEWKETKQGTSWKEKVREDIDNFKKVNTDWDKFTSALKKAGYQIKEGKFITYTAPGMKRGVRDITLGDNYTKDAIINYWKEIETSEQVQEQEIKHSSEEDKKERLQQIKQEEDEKQYYFKVNRISSKSKKPYKIGRYDRTGRERTSIELIVLLAMVIINNEAGKWGNPSEELFQQGKPEYAKPDWKLQNMLDTIKVAREEKLESISDIENKITRTGVKLGALKKRLKKSEASLNKMETIHQAIEKLNEVKKICEEIRTLPDGSEKEQLIKEHFTEIEQYKENKALLYRSNIKTLEDISDFNNRYNSCKENYERIQTEYENVKSDYSKFKKLQYNLDLANNDLFCYGQDYSYEKIINPEPTETPEKKKSKDKNDFDR